MTKDEDLTAHILALNMARGCPLHDEVVAELVARSSSPRTGQAAVHAAMRLADELTQEAYDAYGSVALAWGYANGFRIEGDDPVTAIGRAMTLMHEDLDVIEDTRHHYTTPRTEGGLEPVVRLDVARAVIARHAREDRR